MRKVAVTYVIITVIALLATVLVAVDVHSAESDSLYFTSATDLIRQVDSIGAVCDTVWVDTTDGQAGYMDTPYQGRGNWEVGFSTVFDVEFNGRMRSVTQTNLPDDKLEIRYFPPLITCRELIDVEVVRRVIVSWIGRYWPDGAKLEGELVEPGQAVVWTRKVKR